MPEDRYEIRGKIGQGGVGAVYRAWDQRLNREVAIKRVLADGGYDSQEEAVEHLLKEATSLSSVQHPHIVTVFDAGVDEEGPYVVMELLTGRTIDEMIEKGSLVFEDFREVAVQTQEALIAAQDLDLVHRDLKPTNVMVTWLPSGKFQVKLVDFGLAKFHPKPSVQTIDHGDAVFGSIHFMAPEQFERKPLDMRTDMYAVGCLYYFCLTGLYPFNGETAPEVMASHLQHQVTPLEELRPDLPSWVCEWVMWHISREMEERPSGARDALQKFLQLEKGVEEQPEEPKKPKLLFAQEQQIRTPAPASPPTTSVVSLASDAPTTGVVMTKTTPQPIAPPEGRKPSIHSTSHHVTPTPPSDEEPTPEEAPATPEPTEETEAPAAPAMKINLKKPDSKPLTVAKTQAPAAPAPKLATPAAKKAEKPATTKTASATTPPSKVPATKKPSVKTPNATPQTPDETPEKRGLSTTAKLAIGGVLLVLIIIVGTLVGSKISTNKENRHITALLAPLEDPSAKDIPITEKDAKKLLNRVSLPGVDSERQAIYQLLSLAKSNDGSNLDLEITTYATDLKRQMSRDHRKNLFKVVQMRKNQSSFRHLLQFAKESQDPELISAALKAAEPLATEADVSSLLGIIQFSENRQVRETAEAAIASLASRRTSKRFLSNAILNLYDSAPSGEIRHTYLRLLGTAGGEQANEIALNALQSDVKEDRLASIAAIRNWADDSMLPHLFEFISEQDEPFLRTQAFTAAHSSLSSKRKRLLDEQQNLWTQLSDLAQAQQEKLLVIRSLANRTDDWAFTIVNDLKKDQDQRVSKQATRAVEHMQKRRKDEKSKENGDK